jgi:hypothetical protein
MNRARVIEKTSAGGGLVRVVLDVAGPLAESHRLHGQAVDVTLGGGHAYFALASDPGATRWELLVKSMGATATALANAQIGDEIDVSPAAG